MLKILLLVKYEMLVVYGVLSLYSGFKLAMEVMEDGRKINKWTFTLFVVTFPTSLITFAITYVCLWAVKVSLLLYIVKTDNESKRIN